LLQHMIYRADESPERIDPSMYYSAYELNEMHVSPPHILFPCAF
jgi:hypothetical protein